MDKETIKQQNSMMDVLSRYGMVPNRAGFVQCPFHAGDRTASMKIYKDSYYCFGCGATGDIFAFVQNMDNCDFKTAFTILGGTYQKPDFSSRMAIYHHRKQMEMRQKEELTKDSILDEEVFGEIFSQEDEIYKARLTLTLLDRAKELGVKKKFEDLLKAYTKVQKQMIEKEKNNRAVSMLDQWTNFSDCEYDRMKCLNWVADDDGIRISNTNPGSPDIIACYHPILPIERMKNLETGEEQIKLIYKRNNKWSEVIVPKTMVASSTKIVGLSALGISVTSENAKFLVRYLSDNCMKVSV